jgi:hypothetical protein
MKILDMREGDVIIAIIPPSEFTFWPYINQTCFEKPHCFLAMERTSGWKREETWIHARSGFSRREELFSPYILDAAYTFLNEEKLAWCYRSLS